MHYGISLWFLVLQWLSGEGSQWGLGCGQESPGKLPNQNHTSKPNCIQGSNKRCKQLDGLFNCFLRLEVMIEGDLESRLCVFIGAVFLPDPLRSLLWLSWCGLRVMKLLSVSSPRAKVQCAHWRQGKVQRRKMGIKEIKRGKKHWLCCQNTDVMKTTAKSKPRWERNRLLSTWSSLDT